MTDTTVALQQAIVAAVRADAELAQLINQRIWDRPPSSPEKPYITIGPVDVISDDATCIDGDVITQSIDVWSTEPGQVECRKICGAVRRLLRRLQCNQGGLRFEIEHQATRVFPDADGITTHGVVTVQAIIDTLGD